MRYQKIIVISFEHLQKLYWFWKFWGCGMKFRPVMPFWILSLKWAWRAQFLSCTPAILKSYVFFIDIQMILSSFFDNSNQKSTKQEKPILSDQSILPIWTAGRINQRDKISFSWFMYFWLGLSKNDNNIGVWLKNWAYHAHFKLKMEKGLADLIFKPHPPNFLNQYNFWRS